MLNSSVVVEIKSRSNSERGCDVDPHELNVPKGVDTVTFVNSTDHSVTITLPSEITDDASNPRTLPKDGKWSVTLDDSEVGTHEYYVDCYKIGPHPWGNPKIVIPGKKEDS